MKKLPAYTLLEITVAMLLTAICMAVCYTAFGLAGWYYNELSKKRETISNILQMDQLLSRDFKKADKIEISANTISLQLDTGLIRYTFASNAVIRDQFGLRKDSLAFTLDSIVYLFEGKPAKKQSPVLIDEIRIAGKMKGKSIEITCQKLYSATNLFKHATDRSIRF